MSYELIRREIAYFLNCPKAVYLDSAATALKPDVLWKALRSVYASGEEIINRGTHALADRATLQYEAVRCQLATRFSVDRSEIVFTSGATAGFNRVACDWGLANLSSGDEILTTVVEHHSSVLPWLEIARRTGAVVRHVDIDTQSFLFKRSDFVFKSRTKVLVISAFSNVLGDVWHSHDELKALIAAAHEAGVVVVVDGAQQAPFSTVNLRDLNPDFYAFSAHKMFGPTGLGMLFVNKRIVDQLKPLNVGGGMVASVSWDAVEYKKSPEVFESGTPMAAQCVAWGEVLRWLDAVIVDAPAERARLGELMGYVIDELLVIPGVHLLGNIDMISHSGHLASFHVEDIHAHDIADILSDQQIFVRAGTMCAQPLHDYLGVAASFRVSVHWYSSPDDVKQFCHAFKAAVIRLREV